MGTSFLSWWAGAKFTILVGCVLFGLGAGTVWYGLSRKLARNAIEIQALTAQQEAAVAQRKKDQATLARVTRQKAAVARSEASLRQKLEATLAQQPEWSTQPIPKEVKSALE